MKDLKEHMPSMVDLEFKIDGQLFQTNKQYWTGAELKAKVGIPESTPLYLSIQTPYEDELIENNGRVNMARPEIEYFYVRKKLQFSVNGKPFTWYKQFITGAEIRALANIPTQDVLYLDIKGDWEDDQILDDEIVDLARPGKENFFSKEVIVEIVLIVNGRDRVWINRTISFDEVVILKGDGADNGSKAYTVTYTNGPKGNPSGEMAKGDTVIVKDKMKFYVTATDKS